MLKKHEEAEAGRLLTERILEGISEFFLMFDQDFRLVQANRDFALAATADGPDAKPGGDEPGVNRGEVVQAGGGQELPVPPEAGGGLGGEGEDVVGD